MKRPLVIILACALFGGAVLAACGSYYLFSKAENASAASASVSAADAGRGEDDTIILLNGENTESESFD